MDTRTETDSFGPIEVPEDRRSGAQTQRSPRSFEIGGRSFTRPMIRRLGLGKEGVERIVEVPLDHESRMQMQKTAGAIQGMWNFCGSSDSYEPAERLLECIGEYCLAHKALGEIGEDPGAWDDLVRNTPWTED